MRWIGYRNIPTPDEGTPRRVAVADWLLQVEGDYVYVVGGDGSLVVHSVTLCGRSLALVRSAEVRLIVRDDQWVITGIRSEPR